MQEVKSVGVVVSRGYDTCFAVKACDGLYQLTKSMDFDRNTQKSTRSILALNL